MKTRTPRTKLFLIEMIIVILFFAFAAAICTNMFAGAKLHSRRSTALTMATLKAQAAAETIKAQGEDAAALCALLPGLSGENPLTQEFDGEWNALPAGQTGTYRMVLDFSRQGALLRAEIRLLEGDALLHSVQVARLDDE